MRAPRALLPLLLLTTGVSMNVWSQWVTEADFAAPQTHIMPFVKFTSTLAAGALGRWRAARSSGGAAPVRITPAQHQLMALIGVLDAGAYTAFCLGFFACGASFAALLLAGLGQVLTAFATRFVLGRRLSRGQALGVSCVILGLGIKALPPWVLAAARICSSDGGGKAPAGAASSGSAALAMQREQLVGAGLIALSAVLYSALGIAYDKLVKGGAEKPPPHAAVMYYTSWLGFLAALAYQILYTLPRWEALVAARMATAGTSAAYVALLLLVFGLLFNVHTFAQGLVFKSEGAVGVGLVSAVRGAVLAVVMGAFFCSPAPGRAKLCLTCQSGLSAAVTTLGGVVWVLGGTACQAPAAPAVAAQRQQQQGQQKDKAA